MDGWKKFKSQPEKDSMASQEMQQVAEAASGTLKAKFVVGRCYGIALGSFDCLGGGNSKIFYFQPNPWGNDPIWRAYFSKGLNPPTRDCLGSFDCKFVFAFFLSKSLDDLSGNSLQLEKVDKKLLMRRCFSAGCFAHTKKNYFHVNVDVSKTKMSNAKITFGWHRKSKSTSYWKTSSCWISPKKKMYNSQIVI